MLGSTAKAVVISGTFAGTINPAETVELVNGASIVGPVTNDGTLQFNLTDPIGVSQAISGGGDVLLTNTGTVTFSGSNTYALGTTINFGNLVIIAGGSIDHTSNDVTVGYQTGDNGILTISGGSAAVLDAYIGRDVGSTGAALVQSGTWTLAGDMFVGNQGTGSMTLSGGAVSTAGSAFIGQDATATGGVTVTGGTWNVGSVVQVGVGGAGVLNISGGTVTSAAGYVGVNATSTGTATVTGGTWATTGDLNVGFLSGAGILNVSSGGVVVVSGSLNRGDALGTINLGGGGTIALGTGGLGGSLETNLVNGGAVVFDRADDSTYGFVMTGTGTVTKRGAGRLSFTEGNSYSGGTAIEEGVLEVDGGGSVNHSGAALTIGTVGSTGGLDVVGGFVDASSIDVVNGTLNLTSALGQILTGSATLQTGTATVSGGQWLITNDLLVGSGGTGELVVTGGLVSNANAALGNALGDVGTATVTGGIWNNSGNLVVGGTVGGGGTGALTISTAGVVVVDGTLSRGAGGTITLDPGGELRIGTGGTSGILDTALLNNGLVTFNRLDDSTYAYAMSGGGGVAKLGAGALTFSATSSYTGATTITGGALYVTGALGNTAVTAGAGTLLGGNGSIAGGVLIDTSGTLSPGTVASEYASFTVGSLSLAAGSLTQMTVSGTDAGLNYDQIVSTGTSSLLSYGGVLALEFNGDYADRTTFHLFKNFTWDGGSDFDGITLSGSSDFTNTFTQLGGGLWATNWTGSNQRLEFNTATGDLVVVPEPSAIAIVAGAGLAGFWGWRKRRALARGRKADAA